MLDLYLTATFASLQTPWSHTVNHSFLQVVDANGRIIIQGLLLYTPIRRDIIYFVSDPTGNFQGKSNSHL